MSDSISFNVNGEPRPQGSKTPIVRGGKVWLIDGQGKAPQKHKKWRAAVTEAAQAVADEEEHEPFDCPVEAQIEFRLPKPASKPASKVWADRKPDVDKLVRAVLDSVAGKGKPLVREDSRVVRVMAEKRYVEPDEEPGCSVLITVVEEKETQLTLEV